MFLEDEKWYHLCILDYSLNIFFITVAPHTQIHRPAAVSDAAVNCDPKILNENSKINDSQSFKLQSILKSMLQSHPAHSLSPWT